MQTTKQYSNTFILLIKIGVQSAQELPAQARLEQLLLPPLHTRLPLAQCPPRSRAQRGLRCTPRRPQRAAAPVPWPLCNVTHSYVCHDAFIHVTWPIDTSDVTHSYLARARAEARAESGEKSQGLPGSFVTPTSLGYPLSVFNNKLYSQTLGYPISVFNKNSTLKRKKPTFSFQ